MTVISRWFACALVLAIPFSLTARCSRAQAPGAKVTVKSDEPPGAHVAIVNGFPELHVDGEPFFVHAVDFPYYGVPRDLWAASLDRCVELGINTITLRIPWSWHEPSENEFDFDGHTNPRRDLRGLIELISAKKLKLIISAGPANSPDLRGAGYPDWLLARPEFAIVNVVRLIGAPIPSLRSSDALLKEESAWFSALAKELNSSLNARPTSPGSGSEKPGAKPSSLLYVIFGPAPLETDDSEWRKSVEAFRGLFIAAGIDANFLRTEPDAGAAIARSGPDDPVGVAARWPGSSAVVHDLGVAPAAPAALITSADLDAIGRISQQLRLQPRWPSIVADLTMKPDVGVALNAAAAMRKDLLLSSRAFLAQGVAGISYSNFQVTLTPPGYEIAGIAAPVSESLDASTNPLPPAEAVRRNGDLVRRSGFFLASAHRRTILGIVDWRSQIAASRSDSAVQTAISNFDTAARKIERTAELADVPLDLVDPDRQPLLFLLHDTMLLLISPPELRGRSFLSEKLQQALLQFVERGGSLVCIPELPPDTQIASAVQTAGRNNIDDTISESSVGKGKIVISPSDFYSWLHLADAPSESRKRSEASQAIAQLSKLMLAEHARPPVLRSASPADSLSIAELLPNIMETAFGITASSCHAGHRCGEGLLSVSNASDSPATDILRILPPTTNHRTATDDDYAALPVEVPPRESLMLPLDTSLCIDEKSGDDCEDRVVAAGAELHKIAREGKTLELTFLTPANATVLLHLAEAPRHVDLLERSIEGQYAVNTKVFAMQIPRGPAPGYERLVKLQMPYTPHVPELPKPESNKHHDYSAVILNDVRVPAPAGGWLPGFPALIALDAARSGHIVLNIKNPGDSWFTVKAEVSGAAQGSDAIRVLNQANNIESVDVSQGDGSAVDSDGLLRGELRLSNKDHSIAIPLRFYESPENNKTERYRFDFERSGAPDWV
ncbi:MAG TPA: beta-galactosidase, partial [Candidatus Acidoferrales bacterium]|nr:beta-galactosidase [Candidatus Acidoferrales bacterium]